MTKKTNSNVVPIKKRVAPGDNLNDAERAIWEDVVRSKPAEWFGKDTAPLLSEYCRAAVQLENLAVDLERTRTIPELDKVLAMRDRESKRLLYIATKLRLTPQSQYTPKSAATANRTVGNGRKPWEEDHGDDAG